MLRECFCMAVKLATLLKDGCGVRATTGVVVLRGLRKGNDRSVIIYADNKIYST